MATVWCLRTAWYTVLEGKLTKSKIVKHVI